MDLRDDIEIERKRIGISSNDFCEVAHYAYESILKEVWGRFTKLGHNAKHHYWPHYELTGKVVTFLPSSADQVTHILSRILPTNRKVWFIGCETKCDAPKSWLYEASVESSLRILDEMYLFDFYIVDKKFRWLISEEHHGALLAVGDPVASRLEELSSV